MQRAQTGMYDLIFCILEQGTYDYILWIRDLGKCSMQKNVLVNMVGQVFQIEWVITSGCDLRALGQIKQTEPSRHAFTAGTSTTKIGISKEDLESGGKKGILYELHHYGPVFCF